MLRLLVLTCAASLGLAGCGGTSTKTVTATATTTTTATVAAEPPETDFCDTDAGDSLAQASTDAQTAYNDTDEQAFKAAVETALKAAKGGPEGESCVSESLNAIVSYANTGSGNLPGLDLKAIVKRIRKYEAAHKISRASPFDG